MCSITGETRSGGAAVGLGNSTGSYFWYVWMMPPRYLELILDFQTSYVIRPCFCAREIRSVAYSPFSMNSTHDARIASLDELLTSNAFSQALGTRLSRSA